MPLDAQRLTTSVAPVQMGTDRLRQPGRQSAAAQLRQMIPHLTAFHSAQRPVMRVVIRPPVATTGRHRTYVA